MHQTLVLDVVGLTADLIGAHTPNLGRLVQQGKSVPLEAVTPAVTCTAQSTYLTGTLPRVHGCVANGWYFRDLAQVWLWRQSNHLVEAEKIWEVARRRNPNFTCAKLFWWYNMYSSADWTVTPRPMYRADGRKLPDIHSQPIELRDELQEKLGTFPLFDFWGPRASIRSSEWIGQCALHVLETRKPTLTLVYLPHLDYDLQRYGPDLVRVAPELRAIDAVCGELLEYAERHGLRVIVLSEYGITKVEGPVHINRALRREGYLSFREECGEEHLDFGASRAFAVADHQIAHVYVRRRDDVASVKALLETVDGVEEVLDEEGKRAYGLDHARSGDLVALSRRDRWFTYYWWLDDERAPDYARTVNIHAKPGYDPVELFIDREIRLPQLYVASRLLRSKVLNMRTLLDVVGLDATVVRGSHGRAPTRAAEGPVFITSERELLGADDVDATDVRRLILDHVFS